MKKLSNLPRWLIVVIVIFLCLIFAKVVFPAEIPREAIYCIKYLTREHYNSFSKFCADSMVFGQAFSDGIKMTRKELIRFLKRDGLSRENRALFRRFPRGFEIVWDRKKGRLVCNRFSKPPAYLVFKQEKDIWKLEVLGIHFPGTKEDN